MMAMDLFSKARLKITFLYFILGIIILAVAGFFIYSDLTAIVQSILKIVGELLDGTLSASQGTASSVITQSINAQIWQMNVTIGIWLIVAMVLSAYLLAGITLRPVKRAMDRQKRFMSNISHELRTPLSVMMANSEAALLGAHGLSQTEMVDVVTSNLEEIDRMAKILEFLLSFSNIENRLAKLPFAAVDAVGVAKRAIGLMQRFADEKHIAVRLEGDGTATVSGNGTAIEEMILNLVKNAITYTPQGGAVTVAVVKHFGVTTISVRDTGVGVSEKDIPNIFEAFYRGDNVVSMKKNGSVGLGLAIVREIATFHGATVSVHSEVGKGTTIAVRFPGRFSRWLALP
jgi:two-component system sensor histidine kinase CiaH